MVIDIPYHLLLWIRFPADFKVMRTRTVSFYLKVPTLIFLSQSLLHLVIHLEPLWYVASHLEVVFTLGNQIGTLLLSSHNCSTQLDTLLEDFYI